MRERLIELLSCSTLELFTFGDRYSLGTIQKVADHLIENGVIVPPCKVGDTAYFVLYDGVDDEWFISEEPIVDVCTKGFYTSGHEGSTENGDLWQWSDVGDTVFFSKEEAEAALYAMEAGKEESNVVGRNEV